jgi:branched-chain amino acid transport system substrate-binding protein
MPNSLRRIATLAVLAAVPFMVAACGSGSGSAAAPGSPLTVVDFEPLSGSEATFTPQDIAATHAAAAVINAAGGPRGHRLQIKFFNSYDDPADAVPATRAMLATASNVLGVIGPETIISSATVPIINQAKYPMFALSGDPAFDHNKYQYFWRATPADDVNGYAMAAWAHAKGYTRAAAVFANDIGSQGIVPGVLTGFRAVGGSVVLNEQITVDQPSYRTEVERLIAAHPQVIFTELDPQSAATFLSEVKQLGGSMPVIGDGATLAYPQWLQAVQRAVGKQDMSKYYSAVQISAPTSGPGWRLFNDALAKVTAVSNPSQFSNDPYTETNYDGITELALAVIASRTTNPVVLNEWIPRITGPSAGATVVHTYAEGKAALSAGKHIQYVGAGGPQIYNRWHNNVMNFEADVAQGNGQLRKVAVITAGQLRRLDPSFH